MGTPLSPFCSYRAFCHEDVSYLLIWPPADRPVVVPWSGCSKQSGGPVEPLLQMVLVFLQSKQTRRGNWGPRKLPGWLSMTATHLAPSGSDSEIPLPPQQCQEPRPKCVPGSSPAPQVARCHPPHLVLVCLDLPLQACASFCQVCLFNFPAPLGGQFTASSLTVVLRPANNPKETQ